MQSLTSKLLADIEKFLEQTGMAATNFGRAAVGDPNLVKQLRHGRELRHDTLLRVRQWMTEQKQRQKAA